MLDSDAEDYNYVYMHLQSGSMLFRKGDRVTVGQHIANVGNTGSSEGAHLHFEIWDGPWYNGGHPVDPYPFLKSGNSARATIPVPRRGSSVGRAHD